MYQEDEIIPSHCTVRIITGTVGMNICADLVTDGMNVLAHVSDMTQGNVQVETDPQMGKGGDIKEGPWKLDHT